MAYSPFSSLFQFHKVRLKAIHKVRYHFTAIEFQFHKVRLKEGIVLSDAVSLPDFNSIRFD